MVRVCPARRLAFAGECLVGKPETDSLLGQAPQQVVRVKPRPVGRPVPLLAFVFTGQEEFSKSVVVEESALKT